MMKTYPGIVCPNQTDHRVHKNVHWYASEFDKVAWHLFIGDISC